MGRAMSEVMSDNAGAEAGAGIASQGLSIRTSGLYLALYLHYGFFTLLPLWLRATGASPGEIGLLMAIPLVTRILTVAPFATWAGRHGLIRNAIVLTALVSAGLVALLVGEPAHSGRIALVVVFSLVWDQLPVLADAYAVMAVRSRGLDFGRMRVWGSIAVIISNLAAGWSVDQFGIKALPLLIAALLLLPAAAAPLLPSDRELGGKTAAEKTRWRDVTSDRQLMRAMVAVSIIMGSHGVVMSFGAIQWEAKGISASMIGILQAIAVSSEIAAFWMGTKALGNRNPGILIAIAAGAAMVRWLVMALDPSLPVLIVAQLLHGVSATGSILGVTLVIAARVPLPLSGAAQGLNAVLLGLVLAVVTAGSGLLWSYGTGPAYVTMAVLAAAGLATAWPSRKPAHELPAKESLLAEGTDI